MRVKDARLRYTGAWLLLAIAALFGNVAHAGPGVWTSGGPYGESVYALAIDPVTPTTLYAGTQYDGVFKSTDSGGTCAAASPGLTSGFYIDALVINPANPATLYAGSIGVFKSTDAGGTWAAANTGLPTTRVFALAINPANPATLYAGTLDGVFKSTDAGRTWAAASTGLTDQVVFALAINPATPSTLYVGTNGGGVFKSTNSGGTWTAANTGLPQYWKDVHALAIDPSNPATLYAGLFEGLFKSTDSGSTWAAANAWLANMGVNHLAIDPSTPTTLYAGTDLGGVLRSTDSGSTWASVNAGLPYAGLYLSIKALALDPAGVTTLYAGLENGGVWQLTAPTGGTTTALLPTSAHSSGANGAFYTTSVSIADTGSSAASFTLKFLGNNQDGSGGQEQAFDLEAGKSVTYFDVLGSVFNPSPSSASLDSSFHSNCSSRGPQDAGASTEPPKAKLLTQRRLARAGSLAIARPPAPGSPGPPRSGPSTPGDPSGKGVGFSNL